MRIYDPRLGRFLSSDPLAKKYPWYSPYQFAGNKPVWDVDLDGLEERRMGERAQDTYEILTKSGMSHEEAQGAVYENSKIMALGVVTAIPSAFTFGSASELTLGAVLKNVAQSGTVGAIMNTSLSALKGESGKDMVKSFVSGFLGGAILGAGTGNSIGMVLMRGEFAGVVEETTNQIIEKYVLETRGSMDINQIGVVGAIGAISNIGAKVLLHGLEKFTAQTLKSQINTINSKAYKTYIKGFLKTYGLIRGGDRALNIAANTIISGAVKEAEKSTQIFNNLIKNALERFVDGVSDPAKDAAKKAVETK